MSPEEHGVRIVTLLESILPRKSKIQTYQKEEEIPEGGIELAVVHDCIGIGEVVKHVAYKRVQRTESDGRKGGEGLYKKVENRASTQLSE